ncbi:MAG: hydrogenase nickel incorporation protein HypB [Cycloclasticus pugetii]|jgi:hydrogenase nickel incorporation protein HypB|uniref:Hydrogenase maturation factor HypB n=2 Tax=Cycloclasticus TaxID=34067 RepID=S5T900_9GAMM|nr:MULTISPECIES: hydrogenase nickel incorporation protein HypB [Cycloclasticus]AFT66830.1 Hydrogenase accessory protein HypB [Cycloclasticus sp. P1]AGS40109.1 Hydrogenase nickel incorporation protein HypB [Cycloclasticus zancles 78-ME]ATI03533.1 hydrogenase accessory protein HypB [Cycloclasticus sp. PY97N]EPD14018.1 hydrogenase nickel incorporation protein HypB [Cycloclasticus pugetii]
MCTTCGCGSTETVNHQHTSKENATDTADLRLVQLEKDVLGKNKRYAAKNRQYLQQHEIFALNIISSPGSGKTSLLTATIDALKDQLDINVIEGDQSSQLDAERIRNSGAKAIQINTGKGCHLDAHQVGHAIEDLNPADKGVLFIENVGNLVCPAPFDLGEAYKVVMLSVTEGEDKPLKYPDIFYAADLMIINKTDLLPYVDFNMDKCVEYAKQINPNLIIIELSATKGDGLSEWVQWIKAQLTLKAV